MLEKERGIPVDYMVDRIKQALINAYRKDREDHREVPAENVEVELTEAVMSMVQQRTVVEEVENPASGDTPWTPPGTPPPMPSRAM